MISKFVFEIFRVTKMFEEKKFAGVMMVLLISASLAGCAGNDEDTDPVSYTHLTLPTICSV